MHILHVSSTFDPGGAQVRTVSIINALGPSYLHTIVPMDDRLGAARHILPEIPLRCLPGPPKRSELVQMVALRGLITRVKPDLLVTYNWGAIEAVAGALLRTGCPVVHTEDGFGPDEAEHLKMRRVLTRRLLLPRICCTVVPSRTLLNIALQRYRLPAAKVRFIPNGVDVARFKPGACRDWRRERGIPDRALLFGFVGRMRRDKNLPLLLRSFEAAALENAALVLVGEGPRRPEVEALAQELGLKRRVIFAGEVSDPAPVYAALDVFVLSSATEQMPISLLEAMACGLPAVCTNVGDIAELLGTSSPPFVVPPSDPGAYRDALRAIAQNADLRAAQGAANRARAEQFYSLDRMVKAYEEVYQAATRGAAPRTTP